MSSPHVNITPRFNQLPIEVQIAVNKVINKIASADICITNERTIKLLKHLTEHLDELTRLGMYVIGEMSGSGDTSDEEEDKIDETQNPTTQ